MAGPVKIAVLGAGLIGGRRHNPMIRKAKEIIASGRLGRLVAVQRAAASGETIRIEV